jgi:hypothetical protein
MDADRQKLQGGISARGYLKTDFKPVAINEDLQS